MRLTASKREGEGDGRGWGRQARVKVRGAGMDSRQGREGVDRGLGRDTHRFGDLTKGALRAPGRDANVAVPSSPVRPRLQPNN
eukprot:CAMPEP_0119404240 /NCGR_PEP_ID=MMETSP1334-20130426/143791_1 /TAXON_ID=127549 /ORGANISM="Calcidiscus leptoporus, Strain RCC1130" /LENGTH=82 /DNA_ID=CAMNT_0007428201 /DNA_START=227 /DNA_END=475 /DNA_ORIENTATION=+